MSHLKSKIGRWQGAGLMATTLLGTSVFILPQITLNMAGSGALLAWVILILAIVPVPLIFGRLSSAYPHVGGPAFFVEQAFGRIAGRTIGIIFLLVVPLGATAGILMTYQFVDAMIEMSSMAQLVSQLSMLLLLYIMNFRGIKTSAKLQLGLTLMIVAVISLLFGANYLSPQHLAAINIHYDNTLNFETIIGAIGIAFWSFLGVEAMTHLADDFRDPKKDLIPAMMIGTLIVGCIYLICTWLLLQNPIHSGLSMITLFNLLLGDYGTPVIGLLGIAGGLATVNVYTASVARLLWNFSEQGIFPRYFSKLNQHNIPSRSLSTVLTIMAMVLVIRWQFNLNIEVLIAWTNGVFVVIYFASMMAAFKLLPSKNRPLIMVGCLFCVMLAWGLGINMLYAILLLATVTPLLYWQLKGQSVLSTHHS